MNLVAIFKPSEIGEVKIFVTLMLNPALALVSINITLSSRAFVSASSIDTCLRNKQFITTGPLAVTNSRHHQVSKRVDYKETL